MATANSPFYEIPYTSTMADDLYMTAYNAKEWSDYYNFKAVRLDLDYLFERDPFFNALYQNHKFVPGLIRMDPHTYYNWHKDTNRGVSINMLLNYDGNSYCMFSKEKTNAMSGAFAPLHYMPNTYYLFNNQIAHTIYNFDRPRFLFSLEFAEDKDKLSFNQLRKEMMYEFS